jgi:shikimate dehydrogenase
MSEPQISNYGLLGFPLGHSFSRKFFTAKFANENIPAVYENFELSDIDTLPSVIDSKPNLRGFNVTIPYKQQVLRFLDELNPLAAEIGAVNTVKVVNENGKRRLVGFNTDIIGFCDSLRPHLRPDIKRGLVLGTGGASKAVIVGLRSFGIEPIVVSRRQGEGVITYEDIDQKLLSECLLIVNTTPLGMFPAVDNCADIPYELLTSRHVCYDLVYNPSETLFMRRAAEFGAETVNGSEMLEGQALAAWRIWQTDYSELK